MDSQRDPSISSLIALCVRDFHTLLVSIPNEPNEKRETRLKLQDDLGRLRVWIGNLGAHRKQTDRLSLDHRLREAPELHEEVRNHIKDISEAIHGAISVIKESEKPFKVDETSPSFEAEDMDSDDTDSDGFWHQVRTENEEKSELDEYLHDIQYTITSLYKFSLTIQNPAHRDRTVQASRIDLDHFEFFDIQHVSDKFKLPRESILAQRLGKANTKRRKLLAYHKSHVDKISKYVDVAMEKNQIEDDDLDRSSGLGERKSISTKWTQDTTVSTINLQDIEVASDSGRTKFSATTSTAGDQLPDLIPPPPPVNAPNTDQKSLYFCPYCRQMIQLENMDEDWSYHVLSDLRPYICTFGNCVKANQLYDSYTEWSEHEKQLHRREWFCDLCSSNYQSENSFSRHLRDDHAKAFPEDQRPTVVKLSERSISSGQQCPLCTKPPISDSRRFQQHLARHLQQLSLFVLPLPESEENGNSTHGGESNESWKAIAVDSKAGESLKSTPIIQDSSPIGISSASNERLNSYDQPQENQELNDDDERSTMSGNSSKLGNKGNLESIYYHPLSLPQKSDNLEKDVLLEAHQNMPSQENPSVTALDGMVSPMSVDMKQGQLNEAEHIEVQMIQTPHKTKLGVDHPQTFVGMVELGRLYQNQKKLVEAEILYRRALAGFEETPDPDYNGTAHIAYQIGRLFQDQGKLKEAEEMYRRALAGFEQRQGPDDTIRTISLVYEIGRLYLEQRKLAEAEEMYQRALAGYEKTRGPDYIGTLRVVLEIGQLYYEYGNLKLKEAEEMYQRALTGFEKTRGPDDISTLIAVHGIGRIYTRCGKLKEAEEMYQRALAGFEETPDPDYKGTAHIAYQIGRLFQNQGKLKEAEEMYQRALAELEEIPDPDYNGTAHIAYQIGRLFQYQGKLKEAEEMFQRALVGYEMAPFPLNDNMIRRARNRLNTLRGTASTSTITNDK